MRARPTIRALVIDDSAYSRQTITRMLAASPLVEVVGITVVASAPPSSVHAKIRLDSTRGRAMRRMPALDQRRRTNANAIDYALTSMNST